MATYGFLGLGIMGTAMASRLANAGFDVTVWNRSPERCRPLEALGARSGPTPREVVAACDITFVMLADDAAVLDVWGAPDGVAAGVSAGHDIVNMSTIGDATSIAVAELTREGGGRFLESPVAGSKKPAEDGQLVILAAGDRGLFDDATAAFEVMGKSSHFLGDVGAGARMKLVVNAIMGNAMIALAEGLALAQESGLDGGQVLDVLSEGAVANPMYALKGPMLLRGEYAPAFPLKHMKKDLRLALQLAEKTGQVLHSTAAANETFKAAEASGHGDEDFSAVFEAIHR